MVELVIGLNDDFARRGIHDVTNREGAFKIFRRYFEPRDFGLLDVLVKRCRDLFARVDENFLRLGMDNVFGNLQPDNVVRHIPENLFPFDRQAIGPVKRAGDLFIALQAKSAEKNRRQKLPLPIDSDIKDILCRFVFELHPGAAIRDDFAQVVTLARRRFEERARTAVQLAYNDAFGAVDDEGTVLGHQWDFPEVHFLFLDVADGLCPGVWILIEDGQPDDDLQRSRVGHPAFLAFGNVILQIELNRIAAFITEGDLVLIRRAAFWAQDRGL